MKSMAEMFYDLKGLRYQSSRSRIYFSNFAVKKNCDQLKGNSITVILGHEIDGRVNHLECDVQTGFIK